METAASVITLALTVKTVYDVIQAVRGVDDDFDAVCTELSKLKTLLSAIKKSFVDSPIHRPAHDGTNDDLWQQMSISVDDATDVLRDMGVVVKKIETIKQKKGLLRVFQKTKMAARMHHHAKEISSFRNKLRLASYSLRLSLQVIN